MQPFQSWSKQTKIIVGSVTAISILALALGLGLGLRKTEALPAAVDPNFLPSNKCPVFTTFGGKGEVTIEGVLRVNVQEGIDGKSAVTSFVMEYGSEKIALLVDPATEKWLSKQPNAVVRVTGTKTDCSLRVGYDSNNNPNEPKTNTNINVVTSTTTNVVRPTTTVDPPKTTTNEPPKTTNTEEPPKTTTTDEPPKTTTTTTNTPTPTPPVVKNLKIAVVLFGFSNDPAPATETGEQFINNLFVGNGPNGMTQFFDKYFYGNIKFQGLKNASKQADVFGWQSLSARNDDNCNFFDWTTEADALSGISVSEYDHVIHVVNRAPLCGWGGLAHVPGWWSLTRNDWSTDTKSILYHELGHNLGFNHAGSCLGISGSKVSVTDASLGSCSFSEYGDLLDIMGVPARDESSQYQGWRFETNRRNAVGALPSVNRINLLSGGSGGVYALSNSENFDLSGNKIVSICYPMKKKRFVGFHEFDNYCLELQGSANLNMNSYVDGKTPAVVVRMTQSQFARSMLLQVFMGEAGDYFEDADNAFKVTVVAISSNLASVKIDL